MRVGRTKKAVQFYAFPDGIVYRGITQTVTHIIYLFSEAITQLPNRFSAFFAGV